jgi:FkbM family methyltransferase
MLVRTTFGAPLRTIADDLSLTPELVTTGENDRPFLNFLERHLRAGDTCVDVGANIGLFTVKMAQLVGPEGRVIAYEANPAVFPVLVENVELNYLSGWVTTSAVAADATDGTTVLHTTSRFMGNSSLAAKTDTYRANATVDAVAEVEVETVRLDRALRDRGPIALIKIDVEGAERRVLTGLRELLATGAVRMVDVELLAELMPDWNDMMGDLTVLVNEMGVTLSTIATDGELEPTDIARIRAERRLPHVVLTFPAPS